MSAPWLINVLAASASNQEEFCPNAHLTAIEDIWGPYYAQRAQAVVD